MKKRLKFNCLSDFVIKITEMMSTYECCSFQKLFDNSDKSDYSYFETIFYIEHKKFHVLGDCCQTSYDLHIWSNASNGFQSLVATLLKKCLDIQHLHRPYNIIYHKHDNF